jgi:hypothetical protein
MATNRIPETPDTLISLATDAADGAATEGASIGLLHNTAPKISADLIALIGDPEATPPIVGTRNAYNLAKSGKTTASAASRSAESNSRAFCGSAVGVLKNYLGKQWNSQWQAAGFTTGSLAIPDDTLPMLGELRAYLVANPGHENAPLSITAAACTSRITGLGNARATANQSVRDLGDAKATNDTAIKTLYTRMTGLRAELDQILGDDDPRWYAFGFDRPADGTGPGPVEHLILTPGSAGMVFADWDDARRATRYRVLRKIIGTDTAPVELTGTLTESEYTLTGLPSGTTVEITIAAVNDAGDGALSATATLAVP